MADSVEELRDLADAYGVATAYWDWRGRHVDVSVHTLGAVLAALGVDTSSEHARETALRARRLAPWRRLLPHYLVQRQGSRGVALVRASQDAPVDVWIELEDGTYRSRLDRIDAEVDTREVDGRTVAALRFEIPDDLPPGYHRLGAYSDGAIGWAQLIVTPLWLGLPARAGTGPLWGLATQLYSVRSLRSWSIGDLADLGQLAAWASTEHGADYVLVNPLHAAEPAPPITPSPYLPTTRRFANPIYLRIERIPEYAYLDVSTKAVIDKIGETIRAEQGDAIERDPVWSAKVAALEKIFAAGGDPGRRVAYAAFRRREGIALDDYATWCAITEVHGRDWHDWPAELRHPRGEAVKQFAEAHLDRVAFHRWVQWLLDEQLAEVQATSRAAGMRLGIVHDLAVGVSPTGADSWALQDEYAQGITVGAPPDAYAQTGQNWMQPAWRPDRLAEDAYAPFRAVIVAALRHSGGLRVDHIIGLFRLWWIPEASLPTEGTFVRYDHEAAIGILALEAQRAGAVVIGEDLGTVEPWVRDYLRELGILGTSILWFERDYDGSGGPLPPERWREYCLASVTTHDLPPTAGYLAGDHVRLRHQLGLLTRELDDELADDHADREAWLDELDRRGLLGSADEIDTVTALHRALTAAPSRLRLLALTDAVGDRRTQNQPGTVDEYTNWRVPLCAPDGSPLSLEHVFASGRAAALAETVRAGIRR